MFRPTDHQESLLEIYYWLPQKIAERVEKSWAWPFRNEALPLIDEEPFKIFYHQQLGAPNKPVRMIIGVLILKEMFDLTDEQALEQLSFNISWHVALGLMPDDAYCCQKTLHNFRVNLMKHDMGMLVFKDTTDKIIARLGVEISRQRLDSTHILSNIAVLTRLGLFCETIRVFLRDVRNHASSEFVKIPVSLRRRYLKDDGEISSYEDANPTKIRRRLAVCARDLWRLLDRVKGCKEISQLETYALLKRLFDEQCELASEEEVDAPDKEDDDHGEPPVPVVVKAKKVVPSDSLQTPHDPDVTYSGHKGKGYQVQLMETCHNEGKPEILTEAETEPACQHDRHATIPLLNDLDEREILPDECFADTLYGATDSFIEAEKLDVEIVSPLAGEPMEPPAEDDITVGDFDISHEEEQPICCPAGYPAVEETRYEKGLIKAIFNTEHCSGCQYADRCPAEALPSGDRVLKTTLRAVVISRRRRYQSTTEFRQRYSIRAGIEGTASEMKRSHGLGKLRVRGQPRVKLAVYLKAAACNMKRMVRYLQKQTKAVEMAA